MSELGTYLYGVVRAGTEVPAGLPGIDDEPRYCRSNLRPTDRADEPGAAGRLRVG